MTDHKSDFPEHEKLPLSAYADGEPSMVEAAAPREPSEAEWEATRLHIHARLDATSHPPRGRWRVAVAWGAALTAVAAAAVLVVFTLTPKREDRGPEQVKAMPVPAVPVAPAPREVQPDPLAEFAVLPIASSDEVVLHRIPGEGCLPVGIDLLPSAISLATTDDVEVSDTDPSWPSVTIAPGDAPMIFAAKPR